MSINGRQSLPICHAEAPESLWDGGKSKEVMSRLQSQVDKIASTIEDELGAPVSRAQVYIYIYERERERDDGNVQLHIVAFLNMQS